ncbi:hypothetical protein K492DRAFT_55472 [Lichtheimia hyalospora FSU 10163]|nr:hypothetical protein K492DRAFT_55472 [Lichtheimia hyalospora FSU 10163]
MIEPVKEDTNAFLVKSFQLDGIHYMVDPTSDSKTVVSCTCHAYISITWHANIYFSSHAGTHLILSMVTINYKDSPLIC